MESVSERIGREKNERGGEEKISSRRQGRRRRKRRGVRRIHAFSRSRIIHLHQLVARRDISACIRGSKSSMRDARAGEAAQKRILTFAKIGKRKKKKQASTQNRSSPNLSYLDTVPVILSPLCGAKVVASRSSSNFL